MTRSKILAIAPVRPRIWRMRSSVCRLSRHQRSAQRACDSRSGQAWHGCWRSLRRSAVSFTALRRKLRQHPCHACPDRESHAPWAERWWRLKQQTDDLPPPDQRPDRRDLQDLRSSRFDVLLGLGYLAADAERPGLCGPATGGSSAAPRRNLPVAESLRRGSWAELNSASFFSIAAAIVFEPRRDDSPASDRYLPKGAFGPALEATDQPLRARSTTSNGRTDCRGREPISRARSACQCTAGILGVPHWTPC